MSHVIVGKNLKKESVLVGANMADTEKSKLLDIDKYYQNTRCN